MESGSAKREFEDFKGKSKEILDGISKLRDEIRKYKNGADSFQMAADILTDISKKQEGIIEEITEYVGGLYRLESEEIIEKLTEASMVIKNAEKEIEDGVREMVVIKKNIREMNIQIVDTSEKLEKITSRVGVLEEGYINNMRKKIS